ncbi:MAG: 50S ribosomal protein L3 N(5)-glutamine methyltransferase [Gammaproteobacteria bacterium]|nr:MAG: 50S ribosomal protein L3 N(5)-glutamine methyltransferase [Gammaproteobacteria bacterium]
MQKLSTILDWIRYCTSELSAPEVESQLVFAHGCLNAFDEAHALVLGLLNLPFNLDVSYFSAKLTDAEIALLQKGLTQRINDKRPVPYICHRAMFMGLEFYVDERVLVPRSPIMALIDCQFAPYRQQPINSLLDLCCGSGCIGIASSYLLPDADVIVADIDDGAIEVANINITKHDIARQVRAVQSDLFTHLDGYHFDIIVSNPPYVDSETMANLADEFLHEPELGLAAGDDGLDITRRILREAIHYLNKDGLLIVEVGASWDLLEAAYPEIVFNWHTFENAGHNQGVFVMTYEELSNCQPLL